MKNNKTMFIAILVLFVCSIALSVDNMRYRLEIDEITDVKKDFCK